MSIDVALIQAAFYDDDLDDKPMADYQNVITGIPGLRMLVTTSTEDLALQKQFKLAEELTNWFTRGDALGATGPTANAISQFGGKLDQTINPGYNYASAPPLKDQRFVVADLSPVHRANTQFPQEPGMSQIAFDFSGHHSDIFLPELYHLLLGFFFKSRN